MLMIQSLYLYKRHSYCNLRTTVYLQNTSNYFEKNHLKANPEKCHLLLSSKTPIETTISGALIKSNKMETVIRVSID